MATQPRTRFTDKELITVGVFSGLLKNLPGSQTLALYRVEGTDPAQYVCACCEKHEVAEQMRNFGRYVTCSDCARQISQALHEADCHRGIPRGGFTLAITLANVTALEAKDDGAHSRVAADKLDGEPDFLERLFARARQEEGRRRRSDRRDRRSDGPMALALKNVRAPARVATPPARPATPTSAPLATAAVAVAVPAASAALALEQPAAQPITAEDPVEAMNLAAVRRAMNDLRRVRKLLTDAEFAGKLRRLLDRQRELEDAELAKLLGKGDEPAATAPAPIPTVPAPIPALDSGGLTLIAGGAGKGTPVAVKESVDLVAMTLAVLHDACALETARKIRRGFYDKDGAGQIIGLACVVAANSRACTSRRPPLEMSVLRGHPNLGDRQNFPICPVCKAIAVCDDDLRGRIPQDQTYADILAEIERERWVHNRHRHAPRPADAKVRGAKDQSGEHEPTAAERALLARVTAERIYTCVQTGKDCPQPKGLKLAKVFDPETRQPTTNTEVGVCGKCLARMPKPRKVKPAPVAEAPKTAKLSKVEREAAKRAARGSRG